MNILKIKHLIDKIGPTSSRVMIYSESGTGKDIVKRNSFKIKMDGPFMP